jgi:hypothetical protein
MKWILILAGVFLASVGGSMLFFVDRYNAFFYVLLLSFGLTSIVAGILLWRYPVAKDGVKTALHHARTRLIDIVIVLFIIIIMAYIFYPKYQDRPSRVIPNLFNNIELSDNPKE